MIEVVVHDVRDWLLGVCGYRVLGVCGYRVSVEWLLIVMEDRHRLIRSCL
jgi:hypothetical protein